MKRNQSANIAVAVAIVFSLYLTVQVFAATQDSWKECWKCHALFFDGFPKKGHCPTGGSHAARGNNFILTYGTPETPKAQTAWRYCTKCSAMFYDGYKEKGVCPAGGAHSAAGFVFTLAHDVPARGLMQSQWRYCEKCHALFHEHEDNKGHCATGGDHQAAGWTFLLGYHGNLEGDTVGIPADD